jgi:hypothetical protein
MRLYIQRQKTEYIEELAKHEGTDKPKRPNVEKEREEKNLCVLSNQIITGKMLK